MTLEELTERKNKLVDELVLEIDGCLKRFWEDTEVGISAINVALIDISRLGQPRAKRVVGDVYVRLDI